MEINLKEVLDDLIEFALGTPGFVDLARNHVKEYEGEYDDDNWTERHPSCLIEVSGLFPLARDAAKGKMSSRIEFIMLIGAKVNSPKHPLEIASQMAEDVEARDFVYSDITFRCHLKSINFFGRNKQVKVYALKFDMM